MAPTQVVPEELLMVPIAEELARRAALAVDNAQLYQEAQAANRVGRCGPIARAKEKEPRSP